MNGLNKRERLVLAAALVAAAVGGLLHYATSASTATFIVCAIALALLAAAVGDAVEQLSGRLNPGAVGVLQSALGNLPELMVGLFALHDGLVTFVQATLVGSILANQLLVLGLAFLCGGLKHGTQKFDRESPRVIATLMLLAVGAMIVPSLASMMHTPAARHEGGLAVACSIILLLVFAASIPYSISGRMATPEQDHEGRWPLGLTVGVLTVTALAAALVSDWFVSSLTPAIHALHISEGFTGLVIVAIAGNAVEHLVGVQLMLRNKADTAVSVILNSPLQIALGLVPMLVLLSVAFGFAHLTLVFAPLLLAALVLSTLVVTIVVADGESVWLEGVALLGVYGIIATCFWWG